MKEKILDFIKRIDDSMAEDRHIIVESMESRTILIYQTHHDTLGGVRNELTKILKESE